jgi:hypothetical protein
MNKKESDELLKVIIGKFQQLGGDVYTDCSDCGGEMVCVKQLQFKCKRCGKLEVLNADDQLQ